MNKYTATFADGTTITRKSNHSYSSAWRTTWTTLEGKRVSDNGFSSSPELAAKAAKIPLPYGFWRGMSAKARATANEQNAKVLQTCDMKIEIVEVTQ